MILRRCTPYSHPGMYLSIIGLEVGSLAQKSCFSSASTESVQSTAIASPYAIHERSQFNLIIIVGIQIHIEIIKHRSLLAQY